MEVLASAISQEEERKGIQRGKEEIKLSLFTDDMLVFVEKCQRINNKKLMELISKYNKGAVYKISMTIAFLYTSYEQLEFEKKFKYY